MSINFLALGTFLLYSKIMTVTFTLAFLVFLLLHNLTLLLPLRSRPKIFQVLLPSSLVFGCLQLWFEGAFWFLSPAYFLVFFQTLVYLIFHFIPPKKINSAYISIRLLYVLPGLMIALGTFFLQGLFPIQGEPNRGPWDVGVAAFQEKNQEFLVYYPTKNPEAGLSPFGKPRVRFFWENQITRASQHIYARPKGATGRWSLVIISPPPGRFAEDSLLLVTELTSWGLVCAVPRAPEVSPVPVFSDFSQQFSRDYIKRVLYPAYEGNRDLSALLTGALKAMNHLELGYNGRKALITSGDSPIDLVWNTRIFWNGSNPGSTTAEDLILSTTGIQQSSWNIQWTGAGEADWTEDSYYRPWLRVLGLQSAEGETLRRERSLLVRYFLLWKLRDADPGILQGFLKAPHEFLVTTAPGDLPK